MYGLTRPKRSPHRKRVPNDLPTEKEADIRAQIDLMKKYHTVYRTIKVGLECAGEMSVVDCRARFVHFLFLLSHA